SSRRRHTRWPRDWSSDVCSSDLRSLCLLAARAAEVVPIDAVFTDFRDGEGLARETDAARRDGFSTKAAIHPSQVNIINQRFTPRSEERRVGKEFRSRW